jgi:hypothetical protein
MWETESNPVLQLQLQYAEFPFFSGGREKNAILYISVMGTDSVARMLSVLTSCNVDIVFDVYVENEIISKTWV